jgi:D5 N terminal like
MAAGGQAMKRKSKEYSPDGSEAALAEYLAQSDLGNRLRWSATSTSAGWMEWTGTHWQATTDRAPLALQVAVRRALADGIESNEIDGAIASRLESFAAIRGIGFLLSAHTSIRLPAETDPPGLIACPRGVLDLTTGQWLSHDPARPITRCCPVDPGPTCPAWDMIERHLADCLGSLFPAVRRYLGSSLLGLGADRRLLWLQGPGGDGKSTLAKVLTHALGPYFSTPVASSFALGARTGSHEMDMMSELPGSRLAVSLEVSPRLNWKLLNALSGGDRQRGKQSYGRSYSWDRPPCLVLVSNDLPSPPDRASAERVILARLQPVEDADERIMATLKTPGPERDAIAAACLSCLIRGCSDFLAADRNLGPVPMIAFQPVGLERWWSEGIEAGQLVPGGVPRTTLEVIRSHLVAVGVDPMPSNTELGLFLKSKIDSKRASAGRLYAVAVLSSADLYKHFHTRMKEMNDPAQLSTNDLADIAAMPDPTVILDDLMPMGAL